MFEYLPADATLYQSTIEILIILWGTFLLWIMLWWLIKPSKKIHITDTQNNTREEIITSIPTGDKNEDLLIPWDISIIIWIDSKIQKFLKKHDVTSFTDIVRLDVQGLETLILQGWESFKNYIPTTWPDQARLASLWKWNELEEYQEILKKWDEKNTVA